MLKNRKAQEVETKLGQTDYMNDLHEIQDERMDNAFVQELGASYDAFLSEFADIDLDAEFDYAY